MSDAVAMMTGALAPPVGSAGGLTPSPVAAEKARALHRRGAGG